MPKNLPMGVKVVAKKNTARSSGEKVDKLKKLSSSEEGVFRMINGEGATDDLLLDKKTEDPKILEKLLDIERTVINKARSKGII